MAEARLERRLAAIMAADVAGYSSLMERDEADTFARLRRLRLEVIEPILHRHGGRIVDLGGDRRPHRIRERHCRGRGRRLGPARHAGAGGRVPGKPAYPFQDRHQPR